MKKKLWMIPLLAVSLLTTSCAVDSTIGYTKLEPSQYLEVYLPESIVRYNVDEYRPSSEIYYTSTNSDLFVKTFYYRTVDEEQELRSIGYDRYYNVTYVISEVWRDI